MKLRKFKPYYNRIMLVAQDKGMTYKKMLGVGAKDGFKEFYRETIRHYYDSEELATTIIVLKDKRRIKGTKICQREVKYENK